MKRMPLASREKLLFALDLLRRNRVFANYNVIARVAELELDAVMAEISILVSKGRVEAITVCCSYRAGSPEHRTPCFKLVQEL